MFQTKSQYPYAYQGQFAERNSVTQNLDFMLRSYDPRIGRWTTTDPLYQYFNPYTGMGNNPVIYVDPTGGEDEVKDATDDGRITIIMDWGGEFFDGIDIGSFWYRTYMGFYNSMNIGGGVACGGAGDDDDTYNDLPSGGSYTPESYEGRESIVADGNNTFSTVKDDARNPENGQRHMNNISNPNKHKHIQVIDPEDGTLGEDFLVAFDPMKRRELEKAPILFVGAAAINKRDIGGEVVLPVFWEPAGGIPGYNDGYIYARLYFEGDQGKSADYPLGKNYINIRFLDSILLNTTNWENKTQHVKMSWRTLFYQ